MTKNEITKVCTALFAGIIIGSLGLGMATAEETPTPTSTAAPVPQGALLKHLLIGCLFCLPHLNPRLFI